MERAVVSDHQRGRFSWSSNSLLKFGRTWPSGICLLGRLCQRAPGKVVAFDFSDAERAR